MFWIIQKIIEGTFTWLIPIIIIFTIFDIVLTYYLRKNFPSFKNKYFRLHVRYGFGKINLLKVVFSILVCWQALRPIYYNPLSFFLSITIYFSIIAKLFFDFVASRRKNDVKL